MSKQEEILNRAIKKGQHLLLNADDVEALYTEAGFKEDDKRHSILTVNGKTYLFTGWIFCEDETAEKIYEFVLPLEGYTQEQLECIDFIDFADEEDYEDEEN